jgi:hypothetical protein
MQCKNVRQEGEMGKACNWHEREEKYIENFDGRARRKETTKRN